MDIEKVILIIKYLWPLGIVLGFVALAAQVYGFYISYDGATHPLGQNPSLFEMLKEAIFPSYYIAYGNRRWAAFMLIFISIVGGIVVKWIERPEGIYFEE